MVFKYLQSKGLQPNAQNVRAAVMQMGRQPDEAGPDVIPGLRVERNTASEDVGRSTPQRGASVANKVEPQGTEGNAGDPKPPGYAGGPNPPDEAYTPSGGNTKTTSAQPTSQEPSVAQRIMSGLGIGASATPPQTDVGSSGPGGVPADMSLGETGFPPRMETADQTLGRAYNFIRQPLIVDPMTGAPIPPLSPVGLPSLPSSPATPPIDTIPNPAPAPRPSPVSAAIDKAVAPASATLPTLPATPTQPQAPGPIVPNQPLINNRPIAGAPQTRSALTNQPVGSALRRMFRGG
jgi:hypothetical protein